MIAEQEQRIRMSDGFEIFCRRWPAAGQAERVVLFLHGIEVHSGAFRFMGPELAGAGSEVYGFDRRGMGNSKEPDLPRGDTHSFDRHLADIDEVVGSIRGNHPGKKLFIFGHSIGAGYALWYAAHHAQKVDGLVIASPPLETGFKLALGDMFKLALSPIYHHHSMFNLIDKWPEEFKASEEYKLLSQDELATKEFGLGFLFEVQTKVSNKMPDNATKITTPVLQLHGDSDIIALPQSSKAINEKLATADKQLIMFPGADHFLYQSIIPSMGSKYDVEKKRTVSGPVKDWLRNH